MEKMILNNPAFKDIDLPNHNVMQEITNKLCDDLNTKLEDFVIEGLKRKGFEFKNRPELYQFIKDRCRCEDFIDSKERFYYVDNIPFFLHNYKVEINPIQITEDNKTKISASSGSFAYL